MTSPSQTDPDAGSIYELLVGEMLIDPFKLAAEVHDEIARLLGMLQAADDVVVLSDAAVAVITSLADAPTTEIPVLGPATAEVVLPAMTRPEVPRR